MNSNNIFVHDLLYEDTTSLVSETHKIQGFDYNIGLEVGLASYHEICLAACRALSYIACYLFKLSDFVSVHIQYTSTTILVPYVTC